MRDESKRAVVIKLIALPRSVSARTDCMVYKSLSTFGHRSAFCNKQSSSQTANRSDTAVSEISTPSASRADKLLIWLHAEKRDKSRQQKWFQFILITFEGDQ